MERISVKKPFTVLVAVIVVIALGVVSLMNMATDLLPSISFPYLMVITVYPGASPEKVELEVTEPMEQALGTVKNVKSVSSTSAENYSMVQLEFAANTNLDAAKVNVSSAVNQVAAGLPDMVQTPSIVELSMDMLATMYVAVGREGYDIYELSDYVNTEIIPYFQRQEGVASVTAVGMVERVVQVDLNGEKIEALNERILEKTNRALGEAKEKLDEARAQVEQGQQTLNAQEKAFGQTLASGVFQQLNLPAGELLGRLKTALGELDEGLGKLDAALGEQGDTAGTEDLGYILRELDSAGDALSAAAEAPELQGTLEDLSAALSLMQDIANRQNSAPGIDALRRDLNEAAQAVQTGLAALSQGDRSAAEAALETARRSMERAAEDAQRGLEALKDNAEDLRKLRTRLEWLQSDLRALYNSAALENGVRGAYQHLSAALVRAAELSGRLAEWFEELERADLEGRLDERLREARTGLSGLSARLAESPEVTALLETLLASLSQGQLDAALGFAEASRQLTQAEAQLQEAEGQYKQAREQALASANVNALVDASTLSQLIYAQNFTMPAGYIDDAEDRSWLLRVGDEYGSEQDIAGALLADVEGIGPIRISDIADISVIDNALESYANLDGRDGIMLCVYKGSTAGTNAVSRACVKAMAELRERDPGLRLVRLLDQGVYITVIVNSILQSMLLGAILAILVLALFLKDLRPTLVVAVSIPLSVLFALVLMYFTNLSLNMMTLSGLALGIGMLVDNSVVVLENIVRLRTRGMSAPRAAVQGARQVTGAIIASTLTTISVFFPMVFTSGTVREMLMPLSLSVSFCLVASLLVAVTVVPASASTLLSRVSPKPNRLMERVQRRYGTALRWCLRHKAAPLIATVALLGLSLAWLLSIGIVVLPDMTSNSLNVTVTTPEDCSREESYAFADQVMERILSVEGVDDVGIMDTSSVISSVGLGGAGSGFGSYICYVTVPENTGGRAMRALAQRVKEAVADVECQVEVTTSGIGDFSMFTESGLNITVSGRDIDVLMDTAARVAEAVRGVEGFAEVSDGSEDAAETLHLVIDKDKAMEYGLTVAQIYMEIASRLSTEVTSTSISVGTVDMTVRVRNATDPLTREKLLEMEFAAVSLGADMGDMMGALSPAEGEAEAEPEETAEGEPEAEEAPAPATHKLGEFARIEETLSAGSITRQDLTRYVSVKASTLPGYNTTLLSRSLSGPLDAIRETLPKGYSISLGGESQQVEDMISQMILLAGLGLLFIYLVMVAQFQSLLSPFIILFTVPLAFTGGMLALILAGEQLSMLSIMGFLILMGTVVNNGIVFVDYTNQLRLGGLEKHDALVASGQTRMRPILMTTLTTILAMAMLIFGDDMGSEMGGGMALVITGGLLYATLMTLFIIPILYDIFYRKKPLTVDVGSDIDEVPDDAAEFLERLRAEREKQEKQEEHNDRP